MTSWELDSELSKKYELAAEGYWVRGMSLANARKQAVQALVEQGEHEPHPPLEQRSDF